MTADNINHPDHYTDGGMETIDFILQYAVTYQLGNAIKYISRAGKKGSKVEDLKKARWYIRHTIADETTPFRGKRSTLEEFAKAKEISKDLEWALDYIIQAEEEDDYPLIRLELLRKAEQALTREIGICEAKDS